MFTKIKSIKNFGVFRDFRPSGDLPELKKFNVFYGWNGSGKTTLTRVFRSIEKNELFSDFIKGGSFEIEDQNGNVISSENLDNTPDILVFNTDFVKDNISMEGDKETKPIFFYVGEKSVELKNEKKKKENKLEEDQNKLKEVGSKIRELNKKTNRWRQDKARNIKNQLAQYSQGYVNYDQQNLRNRLEEFSFLKEGVVLKKHRIADDKKTKIQKSLHESAPKSKINKIDYQIIPISDVQVKVDNLVQRSIVGGTPIQFLQKNPEINSWVREGLHIHRDNEYEECQFCYNSISQNRLEDLEKHFSQEYEKLMKDLEEMGKWVNEQKLKEEDFVLPDIYESLNEEYQEKKGKLTKAISTYNTVLDDCLTILKKKKSNPFDKPEPSGITEKYEKAKKIETPVNDLSKLIDKHNSQTDNFEEQRQEELKRLEIAFIVDDLEEYIELEKQLKKQNDNKAQYDEKIGTLKKRLEEIGNQLNNLESAATQLNSYLHSFLGRHDLEIQGDSENKCFYLHREGVPAKNLSEGEQTAIAFVYFITKLREQDIDINNRIVVIDDPVSSFDIQSLYYSFSFIKEHCKDVKQLFILTHNFEFLKHINHWLSHRKNETSHFRISCFHKDGSRKAEIKVLDKVLKDFESEYYFLFKELMYAKDLSSDEEAATFYPFPNMARKFLELFLSFKVPQEVNLHKQIEYIKDNNYLSNSLKQKMPGVELFVQVNSHAKDQEKVLSMNPDNIQNTPRILKDIMNFIKQVDPVHFQGLKEKCFN